MAVNKLDLQKWKAFDCKLESAFQIDTMKPYVAIIFEQLVDWLYFCPVNIAQARQHFWVVQIIYRGEKA